MRDQPSDSWERRAGFAGYRADPPTQEHPVANPWMKKNPALSLFLSGANAWAGAARGVLTKEARRQ